MNLRSLNLGSTHQARYQALTGEISSASGSRCTHLHEVAPASRLTGNSYQRAYVDFFEDQLVAFGYDWKKVLDYFMYEGDQPLINSVISGRKYCIDE